MIDKCNLIKQNMMLFSFHASKETMRRFSYIKFLYSYNYELAPLEKQPILIFQNSNYITIEDTFSFAAKHSCNSCETLFTWIWNLEQKDVSFPRKFKKPNINT